MSKNNVSYMNKLPLYLRDKYLLNELDGFGYSIRPFGFINKDGKLTKEEKEKNLDKTGFVLLVDNSAFIFKTLDDFLTYRDESADCLLAVYETLLVWHKRRVEKLLDECTSDKTRIELVYKYSK